MIASQKLQNIGSQTSSTKHHGQVVVALGSKHRDHIPHLEISWLGDVDRGWWWDVYLMISLGENMRGRQGFGAVVCSNRLVSLNPLSVTCQRMERLQSCWFVLRYRQSKLTHILKDWIPWHFNLKGKLLRWEGLQSIGCWISAQVIFVCVIERVRFVCLVVPFGLFCI